jgi:hypothetical protein
LPTLGRQTSWCLHLRPLQQKAICRGLILRASTRPSRSPYCSRATLRVRLCDALFFFLSPRPTGSTLPSHLHSTSLWSAFRHSLKVCWLHLIPVKPAVLQAMTAPCLHLKPLDLLSRDLMFAFIRAQEDFLFLSPCTLCDFIDATSSLRIDVTSSPPLRLRVDRGLVRHGYQRVTFDQGLSRPRQVGPTYQKTRRPVRGPYPT